MEMLYYWRDLSEEEKRDWKRVWNKRFYDEKWIFYDEIMMKNKVDLDADWIIAAITEAQLQSLWLGKGGWFKTKEKLLKLKIDLQRKRVKEILEEIKATQTALTTMQ